MTASFLPELQPCGGQAPHILGSELPKGKLVLQPDLPGFVLDCEHVHELEGVSHRLGPGVIVEVDPDLGSLQLGPLDAGHPALQLLLIVEVVVSVQPVVVLSLPISLVPDVVVPAVQAQVGVVRGLLSARGSLRSVDHDCGDIPLSKGLQSSRVCASTTLCQPAPVPELHCVIVFLVAEPVQQLCEIFEGRVAVFEVWGELQEDSAEKPSPGQGFDAGLFKRGGPEEGPVQVSVHQGPVGDLLRHLDRVLKSALQGLGLLYPGGDLLLASRPVEGAVDLHSLEELGVVGEPFALLSGDGDRIEAAHPIVVGPAAAAYEEGHGKSIWFVWLRSLLQLCLAILSCNLESSSSMVSELALDRAA